VFTLIHPNSPLNHTTPDDMIAKEDRFMAAISWGVPEFVPFATRLLPR
jgi:hypothetical protein